MRNVNVEKFLADYDEVVKEKEKLVANKDNAIESAKLEAEKICAEHEGYESIKDKLVEMVVAEKEKEFDLTDVDSKLAKFEEYIEFVEEVVEDIANNETEKEENDEAPILEEAILEESKPEEVKFDAFGNPIN